MSGAEARWDADGAVLRDPNEVVTFPVGPIDPELLAGVETGSSGRNSPSGASPCLSSLRYEHAVVALSTGVTGHPCRRACVCRTVGHRRQTANGTVSTSRHPQPQSGGRVRPGSRSDARSDRSAGAGGGRGLVPMRTEFLPDAVPHDLAMSWSLHANTVGMNAVVDLDDGARVVWWPPSIEDEHGPRLDRNLIQLNSIAASDTLATSHFTASTAAPSDRMPGDPDWKVDRTGVVIRGDGEIVARGLTRPHSCRQSGTRLWVDDSGYGGLCEVIDGDVVTLSRLPGWTRGLSVIGDLAVVGTSRVIRRFAGYAPGLDVDAATCGVHLVDLATGRIRGSWTWPSGNQIFGIDWIDASVADRFLTGTMADGETVADQRGEVETAWYRFRPPGSRLPAAEPTPFGRC
ncbi:MAG: DUF4915 domain-containing protein [Ilumatobacteraceae bacterium]